MIKNTFNYSAFIFLAFIPLFFVIGPAVFDIYITFFSLLFLFLFFFLKKKILVNYKFLITLLIIFIYINLVSFSSEFKDLAFSRSIAFIRYILVIIVISNLVYKFSQYLKYTFLCAAVLTVLIVADIIYQYIFGYDIFNHKSYDYRLSGPFGEELIAGQVLFLLSMPSLMFCFSFFENKKVQIYFFISFTFILLIGIFFSGQRTSMFNFLFSFILFLYFFKKQIYIETKKLILLLSFSIVSILVLFNDVLHRFVIITYKQISNVLNTSYSAFYETGINVWLSNFWYGAGLKNYRQVCKEELFISKYSTQACANHPHNIYIEILSELGLIGLILFVFLFFLLISSFLNKINKSKDKYINHFLPFFVTLIPLMLPLLPSGSFFTNTHSVPFWLYFSISLAFTYNYNNKA